MTYLYPFPKGTRKSQLFGENPNNGFNPGGGHTGDDWIVEIGTPIRAAANGVIRNSGWLSDNYQDNGWWLTKMGGDTLVLDATDSFGRSDTLPTFIYAHCLDSTAEVGQYVHKGDIIGYSGNSGTATTGPHCHAETLPPSWDFNNGTYGRVNPETYFDEYYEGEEEMVATPEEIARAVWAFVNKELESRDAYQILLDLSNTKSTMTNLYGTKLTLAEQVSFIDKGLNDARVLLLTAIGAVSNKVELSSEDIATLANSLKESLAPDLLTELSKRLAD